jgi:predicted kinase
MPDCIVIHGPPCSGKSTLAQMLAARRAWPVLAKDDYKELVFDRLGAHDDAWSRRVSLLAWDLLFREAERLLTGGVSCVLEGNLHAEHASTLLRIGQRVAARRGNRRGVRFVEVRCRAPGQELIRRFEARAASGARHAGHDDRAALKRIAADLAAGDGPELNLGGTTLDYDTSAGFEPGVLLDALDALLGPARDDHD